MDANAASVIAVVVAAVVAALVRPSSVSGTVGFRLRNLAPVQAALAEVIAADVASPDCTDRIVQWRPQVVFHLAADAYVDRSFQHPREVMRTDVMRSLFGFDAETVSAGGRTWIVPRT